jgi:GT2 family glycosyltransferase
MADPTDLDATAVVVLTRNRLALLRDVLAEVTTWPVGGVIVVDNAGTDGTLEMIEREFPGVIRIASETNLGATGGRNLGLSTAAERGFAYAFLAEDDSVSERTSLINALEVMAAEPDVALIGPSGGSFRHGRVRWGLYGPSWVRGGLEARACDFVHVDSCLVRLGHPAAAGWMRADFFIMFEEQEWGWRIRRQGGRVLCVPSDVTRMHYGARSSTESYPWRAYYQTRNHLRFCIDARSPGLWGGFVLRLVHQFVREGGAQRWATLRMRARGVRDAVQGRMGLQVLPG